MEGEKGKVCVTGGTGFIASWLIMKLLQQGYSVHTTVRTHAAEQKRDISFLTQLPRATERLKIFNADLEDPNSFDAAIEGCRGVFHLATPMDLKDGEPPEIVATRTINGTLGILKACLKAKTVRRVVYTSSASAIFGNDKWNEVAVMDESFWSDVDFIKKYRSSGGSYPISKTLTEKAALEFASENGLDLVTLVPSTVVGPFICPKLPESVSMALAPVFGKSEEYISLLNASMVHVDDVAMAQIFLLEHPNATMSGRHICSSHTITFVELSQFLSAKYPEFTIPSPNSLAKVQSFKAPGLSSKKLLESGFKFKYSVEEMLDDAIKCCKDKGYLK
ncbi:hypothetical protein SLEP1_g30565 [Rubroshorea leprosula]|uniref:NAD-dependent epimerase/dehydratase domain-containing protein n=1 Tax=Rubroshorea leprosula TaxID=152421 RepID=A0AAV5K9G6_9ROSI|nr:hypothetical protein SLEP1_g30565 [Rubroshorea leprosula]